MDITQEPQRIISICTGIRGIETGLEQAGVTIQPVVYVEIEAVLCANLVAGMEAGVLAPTPIFTDVKQFNGRPFRRKIHGITAGYPCFAAGTLVLTKDGYKPIEEIKIGDVVLTHKGRWRSVNATMQKNAPLQRVSSQGSPNIITTPEHPFYARKLGKSWNNDKRQYSRTFGEPSWVYAENLGTHYTSQILPKERETEISPDLWWIVGRYLADGFRQHRKSRSEGIRKTKANGRVVFCIGKSKAQEFRTRLAMAGFKAYESEERTVIRFAVTKTSLYKLLEPFGHYAYGKKIPGYVLELNQECARYLIDGYLSGDGSTEKNGERRATTVSKSLAYGLALLVQRAYGVIATITKNKSRGTTIIEGRTVNERDAYVLHIPTRNRSAFIENGIGWKYIRKTEPAGFGSVYNIGVREDESYVVENCIVHNCQPWSNAGQRKGADDPRHLFPHISRILEEVRPIWCLFENVSGHLSLGYGEVYRSLRDLGYTVEPGIYTAEEVGAPHERKRLFILAVEDSADGRSWVSEIAKVQGRQSGSINGGQLQNGFEGSNRVVTELANPNRFNGGLSEPKEWNEGVQVAGSGEQLANAKCAEWREVFTGNQGNYKNDVQREWEKNPTGFEQCSQELVNAPIITEREQTDETNTKSIERESWPEPSQRCEQIPDANEPGLQGTTCNQFSIFSQTARTHQRGEFGGIYATTQWPARPGEKQYEWEEPRTLPSKLRLPTTIRNIWDKSRKGFAKMLGKEICDEIENHRKGATQRQVGLSTSGYDFREDFLRALGNGVVPQSAAIAFADLLKKHKKNFGI